MADPANTDDMRKELEKQIADLKKEVSRMSKSLSERGENFTTTSAAKQKAHMMKLRVVHVVPPARCASRPMR